MIRSDNRGSAGYKLAFYVHYKSGLGFTTQCYPQSKRSVGELSFWQGFTTSQESFYRLPTPDLLTSHAHFEWYGERKKLYIVLYIPHNKSVLHASVDSYCFCYYNAFIHYIYAGLKLHPGWFSYSWQPTLQ